MGLLDRLKSWLLGAPTLGDAFSVAQGPDGRPTLVDAEMRKFLESPAPAPSQQALDGLLAGADGIRILDGGVAGGVPMGKRVLLETGESSDLASLREALRIVEDPATFGHCMCCGNMTLQLFAGTSVRAMIGIHHGQSIRWDGWKYDAVLEQGSRLLEWLAAHGVTGPKEQAARADEELAEADQAAERWRAAMPACLDPMWEQMLASLDPPIVPIAAALKTTHPDPAERALLLFEWFGHGQGPWSGYPAYEDVAERLLLGLPTATLVLALEEASPTEFQLEGAARYFAGWHFARQKGSDAASLSETLRSRLRDRAGRSPYLDNRQRGEHAFGHR